MTPSAASILLVTHEYLPYPGGIGRYCAALAQAAGAAGVSVEVIAPGYGEACHAGDDSAAVKVHRFPGDSFRVQQMSSYRQLIRERLAKRHYHQIIAADWPAIVALGPIATPGSQRLATIYGTDVLMFSRSLRLWIKGAGRSLRSFDRLVCISEFTRSLIARHYPERLDRAEVVPLAVDAQWFAEPDAVALQAFNTRIDRQADDLVVLTVARLDSRKGHDRTLAALALLPEQLRSRVKYACVGRAVDGEYRQRLEALAAGSGIRLVLTDAIPDAEVLAAYRAADVFALTANAQPDKVEGFGLVLLEAAAQGLPAVVTPVDAIPEVIAPGVSGQIAATPEALANAFENLLAGDREGWRAGCIAHARRYTWDVCARATFRISA